MCPRINRITAWAFLSLLAVGLFGPRPVYAGIYNSNTDVTYKEYWVPHSQFTGGIVENPPGGATRDCVADAPNGNSFFLEPLTGNPNQPTVFYCDKTVSFTIPDEMAGALRAEIYLDLWRNYAPTYTNQGVLTKKASAAFRINDNPTWFESHPRGNDWSRTPIVTDTLRATDANGVVIAGTVTPVLSLLKQGQNTIVFRDIGGLYHLHDLAIRIYFDAAHPLLNPAGQPIVAPNGALKSIWHDGGLADAQAGGALNVDDDQLLLTAEVSTPAKFVEFHGYYAGYDEDNDDANDPVFNNSPIEALDLDWHNLGRNNWHPGGTEANVLGGTIDHIGTVATPHPGLYAVYWDLSHILSQPTVKFKIRIVDKENVVREAAGGVSGAFALNRSKLMAVASSPNWVDFGLHMSSTVTPVRPESVTKQLDLFGGLALTDYDEAYLIGAYWKNPLLSLNGAANFRLFQGNEDQWALSVRKLPSVTAYSSGANSFTFSHNSGFGEFVERPGPLAILKQTTRELDSTAPVITERSPAAFLSDVDPATSIVVKIADPGRGVNASTLKLSINNEQVTPQVSGTPDEYTLSYTPSAPLPLNALVSIRVEACDYAANCMSVGNGSYSFKTLRGQYSFNAPPNGRGTVERTPNKPLYKYGDAITLTASARAGWVFTGWTAAQVNWGDAARHYRLPLHIAANGYARNNKAVETVVDFTKLFANLGETASFDPGTLRLVEVDAAGQTVDGNVPFQFDQADGYEATTNAVGTLIFLLKGITPVDGVREYHLYFDQAGSGLTPPSFPDLVVRSEATDEGQESFRIQTANATWFYHKFGGGFSSLVDVDGNDWLGFHPTPNTGGGFFRGIPNLVPPNVLPPPYNGGILHPGKNDATTVGLAGGPLKETIRTTTSDGQWVLQWEFFPTYARMTMLEKPAGRSYWFLTEGTPGGEGECPSRPCDLESDDFWTLPNGQSASLYNPIGGEFNAPEWIYFSDPDVDGPSTAARSLFVIHHDDDQVYDAYYPFTDRKMTVFGFGRRQTDNSPGMTATPNVFTVGLMDETAIGPATATINAAYKDLWVALGGVEAQSLTGGPTASPLLFTVTGNTVVSATFVPLTPLTLTTAVTGHGSITINPDFPAYAPGDRVILTATAAPGSRFTGWTGDLVSDQATLTLTMESNLALTANFADVLYNVVTHVVGNGTVVKEPDQPTYRYGELVTVTANAPAHWLFVGWSGDANGSESRTQVQVQKDLAITATFGLTAASIVLPSVNGQVKIEPDKESYQVGDPVTLTAIPNPGWEFSEWRINGAAGAAEIDPAPNPLSIIVDGVTSYEAIFREREKGAGANLYLPLIQSRQ